MTVTEYLKLYNKKYYSMARLSENDFIVNDSIKRKSCGKIPVTDVEKNIILIKE